MSEGKTLAIPTPAVVEAPGWFVQNWRRLAQIGIGHSLYGTFNHCFDYILYPYVVYSLGMLTGGAVMTVLSLFQCALMLIAYERLGIDWVGSGLLNEIARKHRPSLIEKALAWTTRQNRVVIFLTLCALTDPFIVTAYFRGGAFDGLRRRDWQLFFLSVLISNLYWIVIADLIGHAVAAAWNWFTSLT
ncbi:MAG: hypothetical protein ACT4NU_13525 [Chromatiales bacterium]